MQRPETLRSMLAGGGRFSRGRVREVATLVLSQPQRASRLIECLWDPDPGVTNRAADALERVAYHEPSLLALWKDALFGLLTDADQNKLRWNLALIVPRLALTKPEARRAADLLRPYLDDKSSIVKTCAMQGLAELTCQDSSLLPEVLDLLRILSRTGTPAMRARGRILLRRLEVAKQASVSRRKSHLKDARG